MPAALGLSTYKWNNNIKSILLLILFPVLLMALLGILSFAFGFVNADHYTHNLNQYHFDSMGLHSVLGTYTTADFALSAMYAWWPTVLGVASIWVIVGYFFNDAIIHMATGAKPIMRTDRPKLYNILETLCIERGLTTPKLYIIDTEEMNAYASGIDQKSYAITVTSGILTRLDDKEMEAVLAHELTHIIDRDCRLLIVTIVFTGMISFLAQLLWRSMKLSSYRMRGRNGGGMAIMMLISAIVMGIGYMLAMMLRLAISRKREYLADAGSVELTKNPEALISALKKISCACNVPHVPSEVRQMFIENPPSAFSMGGLFCTHPPIADRIRVLQQLGGLPEAGKSIIPEV